MFRGGGHRVDVNKELKFLWKFKKKNWWGQGGREGSGWGVRVDVIEEVFGKIHRKKISGVGGRLGGGGCSGWGGQGGCE